MKFQIMTLFPEMIEAVMQTSIIGRAIEKGQIQLHIANIRDYTASKHCKVDDYPYGGGAGMVMQAQPIYDCFRSITKNSSHPRVIYLTPRGKVFHQGLAKEFAKEEELVFLCGHYEGVDERVIEEIVTDEISAGDYVLTGGELPAMIMMDAISRMVPGVLSNEDSKEEESLEGGLLEYPQYSRPSEWRGKAVPRALLTGDHREVEKWRRKKKQ